MLSIWFQLLLFLCFCLFYLTIDVHFFVCFMCVHRYVYVCVYSSAPCLYCVVLYLMFPFSLFFQLYVCFICVICVFYCICYFDVLL